MNLQNVYISVMLHSVNITYEIKVNFIMQLRNKIYENIKKFLPIRFFIFYFLVKVSEFSKKSFVRLLKHLSQK